MSAEINTTLTASEWALYIGQEIKYPDTEGKMIYAKLTGVSRGDGLETTYKRKIQGCSGDYLAFSTNGNHDSNALNAKLILRPITDITEEEIKGWAKISNPELDLEKFNEAVQSSLRSVQKKGMDAFSFSDASPEQCFLATKYFLSCGFDLFNWVEQGKAIRKA